MIRRLILATLLCLGMAGQALARPVVAILADPEGTETTDLMAPYAILAESGAVEVLIVSPTPDPVRLMPGLAWVAPHQTRAAFDASHTAGADVVIVPFMMGVKDTGRGAWLNAQARRGARIVSICAGSEILAEAGLLKGRAATSHWASLGKLERRHKDVTWRRDARWVTDGKITTTAGVSASAPAALMLLAELAGPEIMQATAARMGLAAPTAAHDGTAFRLTGEAMMTVAGNGGMFWRRDRAALKLADGFDDLAFAATLDGWSRTFRSEAVVMAPGGVTSRLGVRVFGPMHPPRFTRELRLAGGEPFDSMLAAVAEAYGEPTARFVALQLEHPYWTAR